MNSEKAHAHEGGEDGACNGRRAGVQKWARALRADDSIKRFEHVPVPCDLQAALRIGNDHHSLRKVCAAV